MQAIEGILLEPVGCLAEFAPEPFHEIAARFFGRKGKASASASREYWHLLNLMDASTGASPDVSDLEIAAVEGSNLYEDVIPALEQLRSTDVRIVVASSLSRPAVARFLDRHRLRPFLWASVTRDEAAGIKAAPLIHALGTADLAPAKTMFLTDTVEGIKVARSAGVHPVLMMNDPDEAQRLAMHAPSGGIVSFHELPDFLNLIAAQNARR